MLGRCKDNLGGRGVCYGHGEVGANFPEQASVSCGGGFRWCISPLSPELMKDVTLTPGRVMVVKGTFSSFMLLI